MNMLKRFLAGLMAIACAGTLGYAASITITGTDTEHRFQIFQMGIPRITRDEGITATASGSITTSYQLTAGISQVTTVASGGDAVKLPATTPTSGTTGTGGGLMMIIVNGAASNSLNIFPFASADTINAGSAGAAYALAAGKTAICIAGADAKWYCVLSA
jgi:hypothetical protein